MGMLINESVFTKVVRNWTAFFLKLYGRNKSETGMHIYEICAGKRFQMHIYEYLMTKVVRHGNVHLQK